MTQQKAIMIRNLCIFQYWQFKKIFVNEFIIDSNLKKTNRIKFSPKVKVETFKSFKNLESDNGPLKIPNPATFRSKKPKNHKLLYFINDGGSLK